MRVRVSSPPLLLACQAGSLKLTLSLSLSLSLALHSMQNYAYFDACDGMFTNYWWAPTHLRDSAQLVSVCVCVCVCVCVRVGGV